MNVFRNFKRRLSRSSLIRKALAEPADLNIFKEKPSTRFILGMGLAGFSYLMAWPFISVLGVVSLVLSWPTLFLIGSPVAYGLSHLVFLAGVAIAGKDSIRYIRVFKRWLLYQIAVRLAAHKN